MGWDGPRQDFGRPSAKTLQTKYKLIVEVANACGLISKDGQGPSSACVELHFDDQEFCTTVKEMDLNPVWNERFYFDYVPDPSRSKNLHPVLAACVVNGKEPTRNESYFLGKVLINGENMPSLSDAKFHYYKIIDGYGDRCAGELCLKVYIIKEKQPLPAMDSKIFSFPYECQEPRDIPLVQAEDQSPRPHDIPLVQLEGYPRPHDILLLQEQDDPSPRPRNVPLVQEDDRGTRQHETPLMLDEDPGQRPPDVPLVQEEEEEEDGSTRPCDIPLVQEGDPSPRSRDITLVQEEDPCTRPCDIAFVQEEDLSPTPRNIPLVQLKEITENFSDERLLGHGGFAEVYKGMLQNGEMIAVKKIVSSLRPGLQKQFENEVYHLMALNHPNIVRLVGYCYETQNVCLEHNGKYIFAEMAERLLCLEYLPKGSLDKYISNESSGLDWCARYNVIKGICYGLCHLHEKLDKPIIHLDLKPANILLDDGMVPKITDFGLSRLQDQQQTICTSSRDGTFGYMAPEFLHGGIITPKSDIFSLGVIVIEVVTGHRDYPDVTITSLDGFIELTLEKWRNVLQSSPGYGSLEGDCLQIKRCIQLGLVCVNPDRTKRPAISKIINMLERSESIDWDISNSPT